MSNANAPLPIAQLRMNVAIVSPNATTVLLGTSSTTAILSNPNRRGIIFINPGTSVSIYVVPANLTAVIGQGVLILPGAQVSFYGNPNTNIAYNCGWNAIAQTGSSNPLTVLEML